MNEIEQKQIELLRRLKPSNRLKIAFELYDFARSRIAAEIRRNYPGITQEQLLDKLNQRFKSTE